MVSVSRCSFFGRIGVEGTQLRHFFQEFGDETSKRWYRLFAAKRLICSTSFPWPPLHSYHQSIVISNQLQLIIEAD